jgi:crossover junction endodeoxyribonuclease RuvC
MQILGIDPGSRVTGFGVVRLAPSGLVEYVASGCVRAPANGSLVARLKAVYDGLVEILSTYEPRAFAIEKVFMAANAESAFKLGSARAAAILAAANRGIPVAEYSALEIKRAVVGRGHADKVQVQLMVRSLLQLPRAPQADAADALACALCHAHYLGGGGPGRLRVASRRGLRWVIR